MTFALLRGAPMGAVKLDIERRIDEANAAFVALVEVPEADLLGRRLEDVLAPLEDGAASSVSDEAALRAIGWGPNAGRPVRLRLWDHQQTTFAVVEPLGAHEETAATLTSLASLVAHEIRNPLAGISSALEVISGRLAAGAEREVITEIRKRVSRMNEQLEDLMILVRPVALHKQVINLGAVVAAAAAAVGPAEVDGPPITLSADPARLDKALRGLMRYAQGEEAMKVAWSAAGARVHVRITGGRLMQMDAAVMNGPAGKDGLEIPVARRIAAAHGGRLEVEAGRPGASLKLELLGGRDP